MAIEMDAADQRHAAHDLAIHRGRGLSKTARCLPARDCPHRIRHFRGSRQKTFGDLHVVRRLSTKRLQRADPIVAKALDLICQKACKGLKASEVVRIFPCLRRMADLRFSRAVGHTILDEIQSVRLDRAKQLLLNPNQSLKTISDFCGFKHPNSLRKFFLKETGLTLSDWRKKHLNKPLPDDLPII